MQERIVIPLDGSEIGESALPYINDLLSKFSSDVEIEIILLHVMKLSDMMPIVGEGNIPDMNLLREQQEEEKKRKLDYLIRVGESLQSSRVKIKTIVSIGEAAEQIIKTAEENEVDLIAMSTHGRSGIGKLAFGSVTDGVLKHGGEIPIAMVRAKQGK